MGNAVGDQIRCDAATDQTGSSSLSDLFNHSQTHVDPTASRNSCHARKCAPANAANVGEDRRMPASKTSNLLDKVKQNALT